MWMIVDRHGNAPVPVKVSEDQGEMMALMGRLYLIHGEDPKFKRRLPLRVVPAKLIWDWE
jgi:hypothetical protein